MSDSAKNTTKTAIVQPKIQSNRKLWSRPFSPIKITAIWILWLIAKLVIIAGVHAEPMPTGDAHYYFYGITHPESDALNEYPALLLAPLQLLALFSNDENAFTIALIIATIALDAIFLCFILCQKQKGTFSASVFWIFFTVTALHMSVLRLDIIPGVCIGIFALALFTSPTFSSAILAIATMLKLWPGVLAAGLLSSKKKMSARTVEVFGATILLIALSIIGASGITRITSPLTYQSDRGLQIESFWATPFMLLHGIPGLSDGSYEIFYAPSKSFEISGPGVSTALMISSIGFGLLIIFCLLWAVKTLRAPYTYDPLVTLSWTVTIIICLLVTNKVFSPQYLVWLGPILSICLLKQPHNKYVRLLCILCLVITALGTYIYPFHYGDIMQADIFSWALVALAARNILVFISAIISACWLKQTLSNSPTRNNQFSEK
ncbi:hypothetical protein [Corynebacterium sp. sy039]|uniref:hypothetical protein n=1 Tax=Corynebacterium sp. sy039 TaxID=2599641 RepID=UPI0011B602D2|nr:hypothetical protein [Corynebacterium sp. sy039]QDZ42702.1 hypothetical protein FQV43_05690 [Corynebacterium sp. sy039]